MADNNPLYSIVDSNFGTGCDKYLSVIDVYNHSGFTEPINSPFIEEVPSGVINGVNKIFTTSYAYVSGSLILYRNGLKENYFNELSDIEIQIDEPPLNDGYTDLIKVTYTRKC